MIHQARNYDASVHQSINALLLKRCDDYYYYDYYDYYYYDYDDFYYYDYY